MTVQLTWDGDYVIVDGYTYRNHPKRLVLARWCKMVSMPRAVAVLERIVHEDR